MGWTTEQAFHLNAIVEMIQGLIMATNAITFYFEVSKGSKFAKYMVTLMGVVGFMQFMRAFCLRIFTTKDEVWCVIICLI